MKIKTEHSKLFFYLLIVSFFFLLFYMILLYSSQVFAFSEPEQTKNISISPSNEKILKEKILAKSFAIYDVNQEKIIRGQNSNFPLPIASLTKVITVGTFLNTAKNSNINLREETKEKIKRALVQSSNKDADSLGNIYELSFQKNLLKDSNNLVKKLGTNSIKLTNLTGLDDENDNASNIGSAEDIAKVFAYMYENHRNVFEYTKFDELESENGAIINTNQKTDSTFGILASKTGFTNSAGGNLAVIVSPEPGKTFVIVVMHSTKEGRFADVQKLVKLLPLIVKEDSK